MPRSRSSPKYLEISFSAPGPHRIRVGHYLREDLDERLAVWCNHECVSKSKLIEHLIERHLAIEDPDGKPYVSEVLIPPRGKKRKIEYDPLPDEMRRYGSQASIDPGSYPFNQTPYVPAYEDFSNAHPI
jgi:hypothetical protein